MSNVARNHKDNVFCLLYREKKNLLSLYNAIKERVNSLARFASRTRRYRGEGRGTGSCDVRGSNLSENEE